MCQRLPHLSHEANSVPGHFSTQCTWCSRSRGGFRRLAIRSGELGCRGAAINGDGSGIDLSRERCSLNTRWMLSTNTVVRTHIVGWQRERRSWVGTMVAYKNTVCKAGLTAAVKLGLLVSRIANKHLGAL